jgi:tripartite-type tricarboxylate transporter receptor subunit TctC
MPFDPVRDFTPIAFIGRSPLLVAASNKFPAQSAKELFELARSQPGRITYASAGVGSINQIATELIAHAAGVKFTHVPYKGGAPAVNDLAGQVKALAVTSKKRSAVLPDVPTLGRPEYRMPSSGRGGALLAPPDCPPISSTRSMRKSARC